MTLRKFLLTTTCLLAIGGTASAADLPTKAYAPVPLPVYNWTGFYVGANIGVGRLNASATGGLDPGYSYYAPCGGYAQAASCTTSDTGVIGGVEVGYNWQQRNFVYGVSADWTWTDLKHSATNYSGYNTYNAQVDWLASFRGRAGLAVDDTLVYLTGGLALGGVKSGTTGYYGDYGSLDKTKVGWVAGMGVEHALSRNWTVKAEMLYYDLGRDTVSFTNSGGYQYTTEFNHEIFTARLGVNYKW